MWLFDRMDAARPEPRWTLRKVALAGALSTLPVAILQLTIGYEQTGTYASAAWDGFVVAGLTEEVAKFLCVYLFVWRRPEFDERMDGITYATRAGLGFAMIENVLYLHGAAGTGEFAIMWIGRALLAVPGHAIWAGFVGYFAARRRFDNRGPGLLGGLIIAIALHGIYDFALFAGPALQADLGDGAVVIVLGIPIAVIALGAITLRKLARRALAADQLEAASQAQARELSASSATPKGA